MDPALDSHSTAPIVGSQIKLAAIELSAACRHKDPGQTRFSPYALWDLTLITEMGSG